MKKFAALLVAMLLPPIVYFPTIGADRSESVKVAYAELLDLDKHIEQARAAERKITQFHEEVARLDEENAKLRRILPLEMSMDDVVSTTRRIAAAHGLQLTRFELQPVHRDVYDVQSAVAEVVGGADEIAAFFADLANTSRIVNATHVTLLRDPAGWRTDFTLTVFAMRDRR